MLVRSVQRASRFRCHQRLIGGLAPEYRWRSAAPPGELIVDDSATNRQILASWLTHWGMWPLLAKSGPAALRLLESMVEPVPLILTDVHMPDMDGFELIQDVKIHSQSPRPSFFVVGRYRAKLSFFWRRCYQLTHKKMICRSKFRPLNTSSIGTNRCISSSSPVPRAFAPEPTVPDRAGRLLCACGGGIVAPWRPARPIPLAQAACMPACSFDE
jgi:hypothetical protein